MPDIKKADIGKRVTVAGYDDCKGTIRFVGKHATEKTKRVGVELDKPVGKNNGTVKGHSYFKCKPKHGVLTIPEKITILKKKKKTEAGNADDAMAVLMAEMEAEMGGFDESPKTEKKASGKKAVPKKKKSTKKGIRTGQEEPAGEDAGVAPPPVPTKKKKKGAEQEAVTAEKEKAAAGGAVNAKGGEEAAKAAEIAKVEKAAAAAAAAAAAEAAADAAAAEEAAAAAQAAADAKAAEEAAAAAQAAANAKAAEEAAVAEKLEAERAAAAAAEMLTFGGFESDGDDDNAVCGASLESLRTTKAFVKWLQSSLGALKPDVIAALEESEVDGPAALEFDDAIWKEVISKPGPRVKIMKCVAAAASAERALLDKVGDEDEQFGGFEESEVATTPQKKGSKTSAKKTKKSSSKKGPAAKAKASKSNELSANKTFGVDVDGGTATNDNENESDGSSGGPATITTEPKGSEDTDTPEETSIEIERMDLHDNDFNDDGEVINYDSPILECLCGSHPEIKKKLVKLQTMTQFSVNFLVAQRVAMVIFTFGLNAIDGFDLMAALTDAYGNICALIVAFICAATFEPEDLKEKDEAEKNCCQKDCIKECCLKICSCCECFGSDTSCFGPPSNSEGGRFCTKWYWSRIMYIWSCLMAISSGASAVMVGTKVALNVLNVVSIWFSTFLLCNLAEGYLRTFDEDAKKRKKIGRCGFWCFALGTNSCLRPCLCWWTSTQRIFQFGQVFICIMMLVMLILKSKKSELTTMLESTESESDSGSVDSLLSSPGSSTGGY